jgi:hypothetical protein
MNAMTLACQDSEQMISLIWDAIDTDWPQGVAWKAWKYIAEANVERSIPAKLSIAKELREVSMKDDDDPNVLVEQLAKIKNKARLSKVTVSLEEQLVAVIGAAPAKYQTLLGNYSSGQVTNSTKFREMIDAMTDLYARLNVHQQAEDNNEVSLTAADVEPSFAGTCFKCKKRGHKASKCPTNKNQRPQGAGKGSKSTLKCGYCGKSAHIEANCWMKHPDKKPDWKKRQDTKRVVMEVRQRI